MSRPTRLFLVAILAACGDATSSGDDQRVGVSFQAVGQRSAIAADSSTRVADSLIITRVQLVMSELELARTTGDSLCAVPAATILARTSSDKGKDKDKNKQHSEERSERERRCPSIDLGPFLVTLALTSSPVTRFANNIPAGTYREIEFEIDRPEDDSSGVAFIASNPDFRDISVRAEGTYKGRPFTYVGRAKSELELEFRPSLTVSSSGTVVSIRVDLAKWFRNAAGAAIDPATANPGGANASLVARNIAASFSLMTGS